MKKSIAKKLKQLANKEIKKMYENEDDIRKRHIEFIKLFRKPRYIPLKGWTWIVDKIFKTK
jgi:hypothetical protein